MLLSQMPYSISHIDAMGQLIYKSWILLLNYAMYSAINHCQLCNFSDVLVIVVITLRLFWISFRSFDQSQVFIVNSKIYHLFWFVVHFYVLSDVFLICKECIYHIWPDICPMLFSDLSLCPCWWLPVQKYFCCDFESVSCNVLFVVWFPEDIESIAPLIDLFDRPLICIVCLTGVLFSCSLCVYSIKCCYMLLYFYSIDDNCCNLCNLLYCKWYFFCK